ncbi:MAG: hypothetical protein C0408_09800, partial [Odoribacter sp.]|nr:hypothetical protein [Odoribacter sp.]
MTKQIIFAIALLVTIGVFSFTINRIISFFRFTRPAFPVRNFGRRFSVMLEVAFGQTKIFRKPFIGLVHALVFWGFCVILFGSIEMVIDGLTGTDRALKFLGPVYNFIMASGDFFALHVAMAIIIFLVRRIFFHIKRFEGMEMKKISHLDANIALAIILLLMISLLVMNIGYLEYKTLLGEEIIGYYPISNVIGGIFKGMSA